MNFEVEEWDRWHAAFLANSKMREENNIKEIYVGHELENKNKVQDLVRILNRFQKHPGIYSSEKNLRQFLINSNRLLPYVIKTILKDE